MVEHKLYKYAFSMIELIFAIVVIGITVLNLPMITQVTSKGIENNLVQEAIFAASTELNQIVTYYWDENSLPTNNLLSQVVWTSSTDCNETTKLRPGHIDQPYHRRCIDNASLRPSSVLTSESGDLDDLDEEDIPITHQELVPPPPPHALSSIVTSRARHKLNCNFIIVSFQLF